MNANNKIENSLGMTLPELVLAILMLSAFTGVFILVTRFTANFIQPINTDGARNFELAQDNPNEEYELPDLLNDHLKINETIDSVIEILSQPGTEKNYLLNLKCTSLPYLEWNIPSIRAGL